MKFRVLAGKHIDSGPDGRERVFRVGDVVETKIDLVARFANKFERTDVPAPDPHAVQVAEAQLRAKALPSGKNSGILLLPNGDAMSKDGFLQPLLETWSRSDNQKQYQQQLILDAQTNVNRIKAALKREIIGYNIYAEWNTSLYGEVPPTGAAALTVLENVIASTQQALSKL